MAFQFPEDKQDFKAANGITYTYREGKWLVKTFKDAPPDLSGHVTTEEFEQDQKRQDDDIEAGYDTQGTILMKNIQQDEQLVELDSDVENLNNTKAVQDSQINLLETQIQLLAQTQAVGKWQYVRNISGSSIRPPAAKTFYGTHKDGAEVVLRNWSDINLLMVHKTDLNDTNFTFSNFEEGDKVEIIDTDGSSACYGTIVNNPTQETYGNMILYVERSTGGPRDDHEYLISVYRPGASGGGEIDLDILDQRYLQLTGGLLTGKLRMQQQSIKWEKENGLNQMKIGPNVSDYWTNIWAHNAAMGEGGIRFRVSEGNDTSVYNTFLACTYKDNVIGSTTHPVETQLNWIRTPTTAHHAANKHYVDDAVDELQTFVDRELQSIKSLRWLRVDKSAGDLAVGEFYVSSGNNHIYLHPKAIGGVDLNMDRGADKVTGLKQIVSIHKHNGTIAYSIVCSEISFNNGSNNYIRVSASEVLCEDYTEVDQQCRLNIPGFAF